MPRLGAVTPYIFISVGKEDILTDAFLSVLGNYAFPIVACCAMGYFVKYMYDKTNERMDKLNEEHKQEVDNLSTVINNNTVALEKLSERIG
jgi:hypothetical protein